MASKSSWLLGGHKVSELLPAGFSGSRKLAMALKISNADHQCLIRATGKRDAVENLQGDESW